MIRRRKEETRLFTEAKSRGGKEKRGRRGTVEEITSQEHT